METKNDNFQNLLQSSIKDFSETINNYSPNNATVNIPKEINRQFFKKMLKIKKDYISEIEKFHFPEM